MAQLEGRLFAKLHNDTAQLGPLWADCLVLLGAHFPASPGRTASAVRASR
ncbi:hypothetical protein [Streptomyces sp. Ru62]|nr:hypothetical protein [Streptomyces sp. Ru62]